MYSHRIYCERTATGVTNLPDIQRACEMFPIGKRLEVTIRLQSHRSVKQNSWLWACTTILSKELGYSKEEMHEIIKYKFLKRERVVEQTGEILEWIDSTAKLTKEDFTEFMQNLIRWSAETFNVVLPLPEEQLRISE